MILPLFRKTSRTDQVFAVYNAIVAQSRRSTFYAGWSVPDTLTGRFDVLSLHLSLVLRRLRSDEKHARGFAQELLDLFFKDMDRSLREMGVGDLSVPKRIKKMGNLFYGLLNAVTQALDAGDNQALQDVLGRNIYDEAPPEALEALATYVDAAAAALAAQPLEGILAGKLEFQSLN